MRGGGGPQIAQRGRIEVLEGVDGGKRQPHLARGDADHGGDLEQLEADGGALRLGHGRAGQAQLVSADWRPAAGARPCRSRAACGSTSCACDSGTGGMRWLRFRGHFGVR